MDNIKKPPTFSNAFIFWATLVFASFIGCGGASSKGPTSPSGPQVIEIEELKIKAKRGENGNYGFDVYDASELFDQATVLLEQDRCEQAAQLYDRLVDEFPSSKYLSASLYNSGICLKNLSRLDEAGERFKRLIEKLPQSDDVKDASFLLIQVLMQLERWDEAVAQTEQLLKSEKLTSEERMEAMSYRAQSLLGAGHLDLAEGQARSALSYYRTRKDEQVIRDEIFAAQTNFVIAECYRIRADSMALPEADVEEQRKVLNKRAELILEAQRQYFNTSQFRTPRLAAASWYRIGNMYDRLWDAIMKAPIPTQLSPEAKDVYRSELAKLISPLIRHAIRYWEATLLFIERTADHVDWTEQSRKEWIERTKNDLDRARRRLLMQLPSDSEGLSEPMDKSESEGSNEETEETVNSERLEEE